MPQTFFKLFLCLFCCILSSCNPKAKPAGSQARAVAVKIQAATKAPISQSFETVGELKADKEIQVAAERAGQLDYVFVREGAWVSEGQILARIKGEDAQAELEEADSDYKAFKTLHEEGAISSQDLLKYQTRVKKAQSMLGNLEIRSRISGTVGQIYVDPGDFVRLGDPIMDIVKTRPLRVSYNIPEKIIPLVKLGQLIEVSSDADPTKTIKAYIDFIAPRVDPKSRAVLIRARIEDSAASYLKANQFVKVKQNIQEQINHIVVPETAVYLDQGQKYIYIAAKDPKASDDKNRRTAFKAGQQIDSGLIAQRCPVEIGIRNNSGMVEIVSGINNGDLVIYAGLHSIYPGAKLTIIEEEQ